MFQTHAKVLALPQEVSLFEQTSLLLGVLTWVIERLCEVRIECLHVLCARTRGALRTAKHIIKHEGFPGNKFGFGD